MPNKDIDMAVTISDNSGASKQASKHWETVCFSQKSDEWETPDWLFDELDQEFRFTLDAAASDVNHKCDAYYTKESDGLNHPWSKSTWVNPPYGRVIRKWVEKADAECKKGNTVVMLVPARTDTKWFHDFIYGKHEVRFIKGRIKFSGHKYNAPFPCMVVVMRAEDKESNENA